ncbi:T9SS type A sorting domain-containing protein [Winogradskyella sp. Asnod2-B02-A]|uniref:T9SS type A sorting domain-containing protein n=1 Tax=Winogradskyella sp. Asnod2-B02-A TaxID=3160583 RepID=UPI0038696195
MKNKILSSIVLLFASVNLFSQTFIPDDNFEQALIDAGYDTVLDNYVTTANISAVTTLNVRYKDILDLTGIEDFTSLIDLDCSNNPNLGNFDISNNLNLIQLHTNYTNINSLDVSSNVLLDFLSCGGNSNLTSLNVSFNTSLVFLFFFETNISSIDLSANTALVWLDCNTTNLSSLDLSTNINLNRLYCQNTSLTSLDFSNNSMLAELYCINNTDLSSLNLKNGNNTNITFFNATNNPNLTCIEVDDVAYSNANWPDKDIIASYSNDCDNLSISEAININFNLYPNPVKYQFTIQLENNTELKNVTIYNNLGQLVLTSKKYVIKTSSLTSGLYFIEIQTTKGKGSKKLIID